MVWEPKQIERRWSLYNADSSSLKVMNFDKVYFIGVVDRLEKFTV